MYFTSSKNAAQSLNLPRVLDHGVLLLAPHSGQIHIGVKVTPFKERIGASAGRKETEFLVRYWKDIPYSRANPLYPWCFSEGSPGVSCDTIQNNVV